MTKKKIRYSEFPLPGSAPVPPKPEAPPAASAPVPAAAPVVAPATPALATPSPVAIAGRLTPVRGNAAIPRPTPRASHAIPRATPIRGSIAIVRDDVMPPRAPAAPASPAPAPLKAPAATLAAHALREQARSRTGTVELLVFGIGGEWFGIDLAAVDEAMDLPAVRHVPEMPPAMLGVITVRDTLTSVYSPASALGLSARSGGSALVFKRGRGRLAIAVDEVDDVHTLPLSQLREPPAADAGDGLLLGVLRYRDSLLALVDAEALIAACQTVPALETA